MPLDVNGRAGTPASEKRATFTLEDVRATYKRRDAWWTVFLVDPLAARIVLPLANRTNVTPNQVSLAAFVVGLLAAAAFWQGNYAALVVGALLYHVSFVLDCVDGKIARLKGTGSVFGMWVDYSFDRYRVLACTGALMYGQYQRTGDPTYIWLAVLVTFLDMLRYMDALQVYKLRREMSRRLAAAERGKRTVAGYRATERGKRRTVAGYRVSAHEQVRYLSVGGAQDIGYRPVPTTTSREAAFYARPTRRRPRRGRRDLHQEFRARFGWWARVRGVLMRKRIRPHLFSGIEHQMFIFIVGPLLDAVLVTVLVSAVLLLVFEVAVIYKLLLSGRDFEREMRRLKGREDDGRAVTAAVTATGAPEADEPPTPKTQPMPVSEAGDDPAPSYSAAGPVSPAGKG